MMRPNPKAVPENLVAFGANVYACAEIVGRSIDSVAVRTAVDARTFADYLNGKGYLDDETVEAVCAEFRLDDSKMLAHFDTHEQRVAVLEGQLKAAGFITSSTLLGKSAVEKAPAEPVELKLLVTNDDTSHEDIPDDSGNATMEEPMADVMEQDGVEVAEVTWDDDDLVGTASDGRQFNLRGSEARKAVISRVRKLIAGTNITFASLNELAKLKQPPSWWRGVETAKYRIYGTHVESLATALNVTTLSLLCDPEPTNPPMSGPVAPVIVSEEMVILPEPALLITEPAMPALIAEERPPEPATVLVAIATPGLDESEYFRRLVLNANTEPAQGVSFGQLLELARDQEGVDWQTSFLTLTVAGHDVTSAIDSMSELIADYDPPIRRLFLTALTKACGEVV